MTDVIFHSSGSTGAAKEIVRSDAALLDDARRLVRNFPEVWGRRECRPCVIASVHPEHMYGALWRVRAPAVAGVAIEPSTVVSVEELTAIAAQHQNLIFITTPSFLEKARQHPDFSSLKGSFRAIVTSGSPLRRETAFAVRDTVGVCPLEIYGSTEAGTVAWRRQCEDEAFTLVPDVSAEISCAGAIVIDSPYAMTRPLAMGDLAEMVDARRFLLKGRADRRVKVLERYVSLDEVEAALSVHPFVGHVRVETYGDAVPRLGALVVPSAEGIAAAARRGSSSVATALRAAVRGSIDDFAIPRRFRLVRELPVNPQGKTTAASVRAALDAWCREPVVTAWRATADRLEAEFIFPADMECFKGHFPDFPILPGVAQLYFLRHFARQAFQDWPDAAAYRKLKFQKIIRPGVPVTALIERRGEGLFAFELSIESGRCTSGSIGISIPSCACPHAQPDETKRPTMRASEGRRTTGFFTAVIFFLSTLCVSAAPRETSAELPTLCASATPRETSRPTAALQRALVSSANWTMERRIGETGRLLRSSGTVACVAKSGIVWRVTAPFESSVAMTTNAMVFTDEEGVRVKPLADLPHYADIREKTDAFVAGDAKAFDGLFEIAATELPKGGWRLVMVPEIAAMRQHLFAEIELTGADLPTNAVLKTADGGTCAIRFSPSGR